MNLFIQETERRFTRPNRTANKKDQMEPEARGCCCIAKEESQETATRASV